ncbi:MAG: hypothetical protein Kow0069_29650 [Promethearchaeota archaeon]
MTHVVIWYLVALCGAVLASSFGVLVLKQGLLRLPFHSFSEFKREFRNNLGVVLRNPRWDAGVVLVLSGWFLFFFSLQGLDLSVAKPIYSSNVAFLLLFSRWLEREKLNGREWMFFSVVLAGTVLVAANSEFTRDAVPVVARVAMTALLVYGAVATLLLAAWLAPKLRNELQAVAGGVLFGAGALYSTALADALNAAPLSPQSLLLLALNPLSWCFALNELAAFVVSQFTWARGKTAVVGALVNAFSLTTPVLGALFLFGELLGAGSSLVVAGRLVGVCLVVAATTALLATTSRGSLQELRGSKRASQTSRG